MSVLDRHKTTKQSELQATAPVENGGGSYKVYETDYKACEAYLINFIYSNHVSSMIKIKIKIKIEVRNLRKPVSYVLK